MHSLTSAAQQLDQQLRNQVMPYWYDTSIDRRHGGYVLEQGSKQLVSQTRMVWGFAHAHRHGYSTAQRDYLAAARQGYEFLTKHFLDTQHGGYYWMTDDVGTADQPAQDDLWAGICDLCTGGVLSREPGRARCRERWSSFARCRRKRMTRKHGGWFEHFAPDWTPVMQPQPEVSVEVPGCKSANAHLHLMEAFTELYMESKDTAVRASARGVAEDQLPVLLSAARQPAVRFIVIPTGAA